MEYLPTIAQQLLTRNGVTDLRRKKNKKNKKDDCSNTSDTENNKRFFIRLADAMRGKQGDTYRRDTYRGDTCRRNAKELSIRHGSTWRYARTCIPLTRNGVGNDRRKKDKKHGCGEANHSGAACAFVRVAIMRAFTPLRCDLRHSRARC
jgi:hypothetical protein